MKKIAVERTNDVRAELKRRIDMYDNDWAKQLDDELKRQFHEKTYEQIVKMLDTSMNIFRRIVRDICNVYKEPAERCIKRDKTVAEEVKAEAPEFIPGQPPTPPAAPEPSSEDMAMEAAEERLADAYRKARVDQTMQVAHRYAKAATISFILVRPQDDGNVVLRVLTPDQVYVEVDAEDPAKMSLFAYAADIVDYEGKPRLVWVVYTSEERWYCDANGNPLDINPMDGEVYDAANAYGLIPAVPFPAEFQIRSFYNVTWNRDAAEANLKIGLLNTYMNYLVKTQSFKQITLSADKIPEGLKDQILDPLMPLVLSGNATAATLDLNTQLGSIDTVIRGKVAAIANNYGISNENFTLTTQAASGFSLKIANQSLQDIREADIPLCSSVEQALYDIMSKMVDGLPEGAEIAFNPGEVAWPEEWTTEQARWEFEFKNGVASPVDYVIARDPEKSRDEAVEYIRTRQKEIRTLKPSMSAWDMVLGGSGAPASPFGNGAPSGVAGGNPMLAAAAAAKPPMNLPPQQQAESQPAPEKPNVGTK